ncbi:MAG: class I SAM-dependent methyltransferase [Actinobacteria bacterium]|nr:class I SAM-dependent methyltransferase [Actinomycetota bacterium]MCB8997573.1 class I SAM-dependent methyltransferase [Actinomycetota bacterium]MCB9423806.1 class I SAM-dependent methyltransferase [Actinomycetota bacterium]HRY09472.1 class I SAM-dependent methyltransferase [Candidatus Nanopelagicales bacterium]
MSRAVGQVTRGTTAPNRLRRFDRWIAHLAGREVRGARVPLAVDLGFGAHPATTVQWRGSLAAINPHVEVVGVEIDRTRVEAAQGTITAIHGGFEIPTDRCPLLIRAANVLRQYPLNDVERAWDRMRSRLAPGGWLIDGTCDEQGRLAALISIDESGPQWLTVSCRLADLERPSQVAARLPKALIHSNVPGQPIHRLLTDMDRAWDAAPRWGARQRWIAMADALRDDWGVRDGRTRWRLGEFTVPWGRVG